MFDIQQRTLLPSAKKHSANYLALDKYSFSGSVYLYIPLVKLYLPHYRLYMSLKTITWACVQHISWLCWCAHVQRRGGWQSWRMWIRDVPFQWTWSGEGRTRGLPWETKVARRLAMLADILEHQQNKNTRGVDCVDQVKAVVDKVERRHWRTWW